MGRVLRQRGLRAQTIGHATSTGIGIGATSGGHRGRRVTSKCFVHVLFVSDVADIDGIESGQEVQDADIRMAFCRIMGRCG